MVNERSWEGSEGVLDCPIVRAENDDDHFILKQTFALQLLAKI